jgi:hypothetical protein
VITLTTGLRRPVAVGERTHVVEFVEADAEPPEVGHATRLRHDADLGTDVVGERDDTGGVVDVDRAVRVDGEVDDRVECDRRVEILLLALDVHVTDLRSGSNFEQTVVEQQRGHILAVFLPGLVVVGSVAEEVCRGASGQVDVPRVRGVSVVARVVCISTGVPEEHLRSDDIHCDGVLHTRVLDDLLGREECLRDAAHLDDCLFVVEKRLCKDRARILHQRGVIANHLRDACFLCRAQFLELGIGTPSGEEGDSVNEFVRKDLFNLHGVLSP